MVPEDEARGPAGGLYTTRFFSQLHQGGCEGFLPDFVHKGWEYHQGVKWAAMIWDGKLRRRAESHRRISLVNVNESTYLNPVSNREITIR